MKNFQLKAVIAITIFSSNLYAQDTLFIPINNEPIISSNNNTSSVSYGLTDDEITRRVERGLANTVPISALIKWKEKQQKQNTQVAEASLPVTQNSQTNTITAIQVEQSNSIPVQSVTQPVYQQIEQPNEQQPLPTLNTPIIIKADPTTQKPTTVHVHVLPQKQVTHEPNLTAIETPGQNNEPIITNQSAIQQLKHSQEINNQKKPSILKKIFKGNE